MMDTSFLLRRFAIIACVVLLCSCGRKHARVAARHVPKPSSASASRPQRSSSRSTIPLTPLPPGYHEEGVASWYGPPFDGRQAADGEIYNMETLVAAHRTMPFNTWVRVTNLSNGKNVEVRIIDRGPFVEGRLIDLSKAAARQIDLLGPGVGKVRLEVVRHLEERDPEEQVVQQPLSCLSNPPAPQAAISTLNQTVGAADRYTVQVGAFSSYDNAERVRREYALRFGSADLVLQRGLYRVMLGRRMSMEAAQRIAMQLGAESKNVFVVRVDPAQADPVQ